MTVLPISCPLPSPCVLQCHVEPEKFPHVCLSPHLDTQCLEVNRETPWGRRRRTCCSLPYSRVCWRLAPNTIRWANCDTSKRLDSVQNKRNTSQTFQNKTLFAKSSYCYYICQTFHSHMAHNAVYIHNRSRFTTKIQTSHPSPSCIITAPCRYNIL